jgi:hypothetical protein
VSKHSYWVNRGNRRSSSTPPTLLPGYGVGHIPSEQAGMEECVRWLKDFVKSIQVDLVLV